MGDVLHTAPDSAKLSPAAGAPRSGRVPDPGQSMLGRRPATSLQRETGSAGDTADVGTMLPASLRARYAAVRQLGAGAQAIVVLAHDVFLGRDVAIKVVRARRTASERANRQMQEAHVVASVTHRALTTLYDAGIDVTDQDAPVMYLVMEYIPGSDLQSRLRSGTLDAVQACWLGHDLSDALDHLHAAGFLHRDIKPANVLLVDPDSDRVQGKLTDFGISALIAAPHVSGQVTGTAAYIAPEQVEDLPPTGASDMYALGLVLIEALSGHRAFPGAQEEAAFARLDRQPEIPEGLPSRLAGLLRAMTARRASSRPSAAEAATLFRELAIEGMTRPREQQRAAIDEEAARLAAVQRYQILDTPPEDAFDDVAALASRILRVPAALVAILDKDRIWFKSRHDFSEPEIDRNTTLTSLAGDGVGPWSVPDAATDPRTRDNPLVHGAAHIRAYAAAPLRTHDGHTIGALCAVDRRPHHFTAEDLAILGSLAAVIMRELELRLASRRAIFNGRAGDGPGAADRVRPNRRDSDRALSIGSR